MSNIFEMFGDSIISEQTQQAPNNKIFVISAGGSIFFGEDVDKELVVRFVSTIEELISEGFRFCIVVGGGKPAREYCRIADTLGVNNFVKDKAAILATKANATILAGLFKNSDLCIDKHISDSKAIISSGKIPIYGGVLPSLTTDSVAALLAEYLDAVFVNLTNVNGIYSSDPRYNKDAKLYDKISYNKLLSILREANSLPGQNFVLDIPCVLILRRSKIKAAVLNGRNIDNLRSFIKGQSFEGTLIEPSNEDFLDNKDTDYPNMKGTKSFNEDKIDLDEIEY
ncbi:MAG: UMP kinase [Candidatus Diapherotrites archaeon]|nr:UMP kinase [Candidatus Diapherotrites archaeon]